MPIAIQHPVSTPTELGNLRTGLPDGPGAAASNDGRRGHGLFGLGGRIADAVFLFVRATDNSIWMRRWAVTDGWLPWSSLGSPPGSSSTSAPAAACKHGGQVDVFVVSDKPIDN
jgi:hypothetical protein